MFKVVCLHARHINFSHRMNLRNLRMNLGATLLWISGRLAWRGTVTILYVSIPAWDEATLDKVFTSGPLAPAMRSAVHHMATCSMPQPDSEWVCVWLCMCVCVQISHVVFHTTESPLIQQFHQTCGRVWWQCSLKHCSCRERLLLRVGWGLNLKSMILFS